MLRKQAKEMCQCLIEALMVAQAIELKYGNDYSLED